jgi:ADP-ribosylglycohydrolase
VSADASRTARTLLSLEGLAVGDAFGEQFSGEPATATRRIDERILTPPPWPYTDDTEMAISVTEILLANATIDQDALATALASRMKAGRGYGRNTHALLSAIRQGGSWRQLSRAAFSGAGSHGSGAAVRAAPLGAYFAEEPIERIVDEARRSAEVTHAHPEGIAGAITVAVATALAFRDRDNPRLGRTWLGQIAAVVPRGETRDGIRAAIALAPEALSTEAARVLGNGANVSSADTVPLCLWMVAHHGDDFELALWKTVGALGDRDTTCAIVGGILAPRAGRLGIPAVWRHARERSAELDETQSEQDPLAATREQ